MTYANKGSDNNVVCLSVKFQFDLATFANSGEVQTVTRSVTTSNPN